MLTIYRGYTPVVTIGRLALSIGVEIYTLENPWKENKPYVSCVPEGLYTIRRDDFRGKYENFKVVNPPLGRSAIEFHIGTTVRDTHGCILTGLKLGPNWNLIDSGAAFESFMLSLKDVDEETLHITNYRPSMVKKE